MKVELSNYTSNTSWTLEAQSDTLGNLKMFLLEVYPDLTIQGRPRRAAEGLVISKWCKDNLELEYQKRKIWNQQGKAQFGTKKKKDNLAPKQENNHFGTKYDKRYVVSQ